MGIFDSAEEFGKRISSVRGWMQMQRPEFGDFMDVSESTVWRWEAGDIGKKRASEEGRRQFAMWIRERTGCPPELLGLTELDSVVADRLRHEMRQELQMMKMELLQEIEAVLRAQASQPSSSGQGGGV
jgi:hypothetical protein